MPNPSPTITPGQLIAAIEVQNGYPLNGAQRDAVLHGNGPLWIIAGPGTGKTEVLVCRCLRLMCCDGLDPKSILATTFTQKAAINLRQRIDEGLIHLRASYPQLVAIDSSGLRIGTLHALCNDVLQEYRYEPYRNLRLLDDVESSMLFRGQVASYIRDHCPNLIAHFRFLFSNRPQLSLWDITKALSPLLSRIVEDDLDTTLPVATSAAWTQAIAASQLYDQKLAEKYACDFARLQLHFVRFLSEPSGQLFLAGDVAVGKPPLLHVLVDEYQDTNPIQEKIYFALANRAPHNIAVVGDDDQALYRFRGGSVESMVGFGRACQRWWNVNPVSTQLRENYRSHTTIVNWCEQFISASQRMQVQDARAPGKQGLVASSGRSQNYPAVGYIREQRVSQLGNTFATTVQGLIQNHVVDDLSQCVLLLSSTREGPRGAGPYVDALRQHGIPYYNPRSKAFVEQPEVRALLGTLIAVLDPNGTVLNGLLGPDLTQLVADCLTEYQSLAPNNPELRQYVDRSNIEIRAKRQGDEVTPAVPTILYRILSLQPFATFQQDVEQDLRLSKVTRLLEAFCAQYARRLNMDRQKTGQINDWWLSQFYYVFCGYLSTFGIDDDEEEDVICPPGRLPIMTIHQSKGLEFDFVFVGTLGRSVSADNSVRMEEACRPLRRNAWVNRHTAEDLAWHDDIRSHYVAYSRAKHALILLATTQQLTRGETETASFGVGGGTGFTRQFRRL
jgi:DNA helicase II / ATP-dependent DNA helicase PcrA